MMMMMMMMMMPWMAGVFNKNWQGGGKLEGGRSVVTELLLLHLFWYFWRPWDVTQDPQNEEALIGSEPEKSRRSGASSTGPKVWFSWANLHSLKMDVSKKGNPPIIHFYRVFHHKPSILGYPYFWKHPNVATQGHSSLLVFTPESSTDQSLRFTNETDRGLGEILDAGWGAWMEHMPQIWANHIRNVSNC